MNKRLQLEILTLSNISGYWRKKTKIDLDNDYLGMLVWVFEESTFWRDSLKKKLIQPLEEFEYNGNKINLNVHKKLMTITTLFAEDPEYFAIKIDRQVLLDLISKWEELVAKGAQEITFIRRDDATITITDNIPDSMIK